MNRKELWLAAKMSWLAETIESFEEDVPKDDRNCFVGAYPESIELFEAAVKVVAAYKRIHGEPIHDEEWMADEEES